MLLAQNRGWYICGRNDCTIRVFDTAISCALLFSDQLQVMVFVHARNATVKTAMSLRDLATNYGDLSYFQPEQSPRLGQAEKQVRLTFYVFICTGICLCVCVYISVQ